MKSPWNRKNPLMSMYLSGANAVAGAARARAEAEIRRRTKAMMAAGVKRMVDSWSDILSGTPSRKRKPR